MDDHIRSVNVYPCVQRNKSNNVRAVNKFTCAKVLKWRQNQIHEYLQFMWRTGGQVSQHHRSPRTDARLSTSSSPCKSQHFAVEEPAKNMEMLTQDIQFTTWLNENFYLFENWGTRLLPIHPGLYSRLDAISGLSSWFQYSSFSGAALSPFIANMFSTLNWRLSLIDNFLSIYYYRYFRTLKAWCGLWKMNIFLLKAEP